MVYEQWFLGCVFVKLEGAFAVFGFVDVQSMRSIF